jgi:hypothetical protein
MRRRIILWIILGPLMLTVGSVLAQVFTSMVTVGVGSGPLIPGVAAQTSVNVPSLVQANYTRAASLAYPLNVSSGDVLIVVGSWQGSGGTSTVADTLSTSWTSAVVENGTFVTNCQIFVGQASSSGADTVTLTAPNGFNGIGVTEWKNLTTTRDGTAGGTTNGALSLTTTTAYDLIFAQAEGGGNSGITTGLFGWGTLLSANGSDSGGIQSIVQPVAGVINAGVQNNSNANGLAFCAAAFKHS